MNQVIVILQRQNVKISETKLSESNTQILTFTYHNKTYEKLNISFKITLQDNALNFCKNYFDKHQKQCILLDEKDIFSVWSEVLPISEIKEPSLSESENSTLTFTTAKNLYVTQATLLIVQILLTDIEDLMGNRHKENFKQELIKIFQKSNLPETESLEKINSLLMVDPLNKNQLPSWEQEQVKQIFSSLIFLATKYFNNTSFVEEILEIFQELPEYNEPEFLNCCMQFVNLCSI
ncbi:hypothetical protein Sta7437_3966 [Stanieria cyanosphaera PCC 7437]|uniref:Uncharacterized protein n=1 Tax=Stanieria cyanosphaera (strain ATCC 29371 / PCC 7437) TaxID=111780 RepID=K9XY37_STAC7|nr:hypothetical protein [Stanieria cyanosphaera]AFZ37448.1 hypothetical protein Sta7437_3966 [Stanieria cyanosphaera PCC 7437]